MSRRSYTITDTQMLRAAERSLREHRATRPATPTEASAIAARFRAAERHLLEEAAGLRGLSMPVGVRGPSAIDDQHAAARDLCRAQQDAGRIEQLASRERGRAESWEAIADRPSVAWLATEAEYLGRVEYYRALVASAAAAMDRR